MMNTLYDPKYRIFFAVSSSTQENYRYFPVWVICVRYSMIVLSQGDSAVGSPIDM